MVDGTSMFLLAIDYFNNGFVCPLLMFVVFALVVHSFISNTLSLCYHIITKYKENHLLKLVYTGVSSRLHWD